MSRFSSAGIKLAVIVLAAAALAGCGRKGPLELPPSASAAPVAGARSDVAEPPPSSVRSQAGALFAPQDEDAAPVAPRGRKKPFILDPLL